MAESEQIEFYNNFIDHFKSQKDNGRNTRFRQWVSKWVFKPKKVLDFGCAFGYNSQELQRDVGCEVHGIDLSPKCIEYAKELYPECSWYSGDITDGFDPGVRDFEFVLMSDVIEHVPLNRHETLFQKLAEWTGSGAVLLASIPNPENYEEAKVQTYQPVEERVEIPELLSSFQRAGFSRVVSLFLDGGLYYRMVIQKVSP